MGCLRPWHIAVLVVVLILLFGAKRLPDAARSLGRSMRILKAEVKGMSDDDVESKADGAARPGTDSTTGPSWTGSRTARPPTVRRMNRRTTRSSASATTSAGVDRIARVRTRVSASRSSSVRRTAR